MTNQENRQLWELLDKFIREYPEEGNGYYGRAMDIAVAKSAQQMLPIQWVAELTLYDGSKKKINHYSKAALISSCDYFIKNKNIPTHTGYDSQPVSYRILS